MKIKSMHNPIIEDKSFKEKNRTHFQSRVTSSFTVNALFKIL